MLIIENGALDKELYITRHFCFLDELMK